MTKEIEKLELAILSDVFRYRRVVILKLPKIALTSRSDEGLTLETSASLSLHGGNLTPVNLFDSKFQCFTSPPGRDTIVSLQTNLVIQVLI